MRFRRPRIDRQPSTFAHMDAIAGKAARFLADDDFGAYSLVGAFKAGSRIFTASRHRIVEPESDRYCRQHVAGD